MVKVLIQAQTSEGKEAQAPEIYEFTRVPSVDEYVELDFAGDTYRIISVVHTPYRFPDGEDEFDAQIFVVGEDHRKNIEKKGWA